MSLALETPAAEEPVSLAEAKAHLKIDTDDDDALIASLITAARIRAEWYTGRAFVVQGWSLWLDAWPCDGVVEIPLPPLIAVAAVTAYAEDDSAAVLDPATYRVDTVSAPGRLALRRALSPPAVGLRPVDAVCIRFAAGYGPATAVPAPIRQGILRIVADLYANRGDGAGGVGTAALALLAPYKVLSL